MELSYFSKISNNTNNCRNYTSLDIKEKIKILHKINSNDIHNSFKKKDKNTLNKDVKLLSSTLPSYVLKRNSIYKKKLIKNYSSKNSPNIYVIRNSKKQIQNLKKEDIINEIKSDEILKQTIKKELKNEIINEFLEDLVNIDDKKVLDFLKIKNKILSSDKLKNNFYKKLLTKDDFSPDYMSPNTNLSLNEIYYTDKKNNIINNRDNQFIFNIDEIEMKNNLEHKRVINSSTPVKTIFNNLFINNNEKYIIKKPYQDYNNKNINNLKKNKIFMHNNAQNKLSKFEFQIINERKNNIINTDSFSDFASKSNILSYEDDIDIEKDNINPKKIIENEIYNEKDMNEICNYKNEENDTIVHCINSIKKEEKNQNNKIFEKDYVINHSDNELENNSKKGLLSKINISDKKGIKIFDKIHKKKKDIINRNIVDKKINLKKYDIKIEDEKRKKLIKKIIENSKKVIKNKNIFNDKYINLFVLKKNIKNKYNSKEEILNKSFIVRNNKNIKLNPINQRGYNSFSENKKRNKTYSNFLNEQKSNIFRISHIKNYLKVLQKDNNKHLLNTKWLKNISKKNIPLLCFDKKKNNN